MQGSLRHRGVRPLLGQAVQLRPRQRGRLLALAALAVLAGPWQLQAASQQLRRCPPGAQVLCFQQSIRSLVSRQQLRSSQQPAPLSERARGAARSAPGTHESVQPRQQLSQLYQLLPLHQMPPQRRSERWRKRSRALPQRLPLPLPPQAFPLCSCLSRRPSEWKVGGP